MSEYEVSYLLIDCYTVNAVGSMYKLSLKPVLYKKLSTSKIWAMGELEIQIAPRSTVSLSLSAVSVAENLAIIFGLDVKRKTQSLNFL